MLRLFILITVFTLVVVGLPQYTAFDALFDEVRKVPSRAVLLADITALCVSLPLLHRMTRQPTGWLHTRPGMTTRLAYNGLIGLVIAGLFDIFEALSGYAVNLVSLVLLPLAFVAGELVYQGVIAIWARARPKPDVLSETDIAETFSDASTEDSKTKPAGLPRLLVTLPIYAFVLVFLPQREELRRLEASLINIDPDIGLAVSALALLVGLAAPRLYKAYLQKQATRNPPADLRAIERLNLKYSIMMSFAIGLGMAALINIVAHFIGYPASLGLLILMPLGFGIAELVYVVLNWRLVHGPRS